MKATAMLGIFWDLQQHLRGQLKHGQLKDNQYEAYDEIREFLYEAMHDKGINMDELYS